MMSKLTDFYTHKASLQEEGKPIGPTMGNVGRPTAERRTVARTDRAIKNSSLKGEKSAHV